MEDQTFPKYQYSEFIKSGGRDAQIVVRSDSWEEFQTQLKQALSVVKAASKTNEAPNPSNDVVEAWKEKEEVKYCSKHGSPMKKAVSKKTNKPYWYHDGENGEGRCFGNGYLASNQ